MRTPRSRYRFRAGPGVVVLALLAAGCTSLTVPAVSDWPVTLPSWPAKNAAPEAPQTLAVVWNAAVLQHPGSTPTRGLGGLVTFYGPDRSTPIRVEGQLNVYVYDDASRPADKVAPDAKYVFPAEQLAGHYGQSALGHSYSIWIPWDRAGGPRQELALTACFQPVEGEPVMGMPTRVVLEGPTRTGGQPDGTSTVGPRAASPDGSPDAAGSPSRPARNEPVREMTTTTLPLPRAVER